MESFDAVVICSRQTDGSCAMLEEYLLFPAALWLSETLKRNGVRRIAVLCHDEDQEKLAECFPDGTLFDRLQAPRSDWPFQAGVDRVLVVAQPALLLPESMAVMRGRQAAEPDVFFTDAQALTRAYSQGEELLAAVRTAGRPHPPVQVYPLESGLMERMGGELLIRQLSAGWLAASGARAADLNSFYVDPRTSVGSGTVLLPGTIIKGNTVIGKDCVIGPNAVIRDCVIGDRVTINASQLNESTVGDDTTVGPFAYVRPNCHVGRQVKVGDFVEIKNSVIGDGTKISHLTYVGDSDVGGHVNFGCGTVTVNYDGAAKYRTTIGDCAFIGCNTNLVAPVTVGAGAYTAAGSTITEDVPGDSLAIARTQQVVKKNWAAKRRTRQNGV